MKLLMVASLLLAVGAVGLVGCKKAKPKALDPHSAAGVMQRLQEQGRFLNDAFGRKDFAYIHDYAYYFNGLTQAFFSKLDDQEKSQLRSSMDELSTLSNQLDRAAGGHHAEATEATLQRLTVVLQDVDKQFQGMKKHS